MVRTSPRLTLTADANGDGSDETGVFELDQGTEMDPTTITAGVEPLSPIGSAGGGFLDQIVNVFSGGRKDVRLDLGAGIHFVEVSAITTSDDDRIWGDTDDGSLPADGTGEHALARLDVFKRYLTQGTFDSRTAATLEYGLYESGSGEPLDPLDVTPVEPSLQWPYRNDPDALQVSIRLIATASLSSTDTPTNRELY